MVSLRCWLAIVRVSLCAALLFTMTRSAVSQEIPLFDARGTRNVTTLPHRWGSSISFQSQELPADANTQPRDCASPEDLAIVMKPLSQIEMKIGPGPEYLPPSCYEQHHPSRSRPHDITHLPRSSSSRYFHWQASGLVRYPLYFEEVALERYGLGYSPILQPVVSGVRFFGRVATLPYRLGVDPPNRIIYTLGYERPGNFAPSVREHLPWSWRGAIYQAATVVGGVYLFP